MMILQNNDNLKKQLFISGPPRSGTTLLELILTSHNSICITPETYFIEKILNNRRFLNNKLRKIDIDFLIKILKTDSKLNSWPLFSLDAFLQKYPVNEHTEIGKLIINIFIFYADCLGKKDIQYIGNKKGLYAYGYGTIVKKIFPNAKFIYIVRDPKDVVHSITKNLKEKSIVNAAMRCFYTHINILKMRKKYDEDVLIVKYEELTKTPYNICKTICRFLDIEFEKNMVQFYKYNKDSKLLIYEKRNLHRNTTKPINTQYSGQWKRKKYFTRFEIRIIESICFKYMQYFNYDFHFKNSNFSRLVLNLYYLFIYKTKVILMTLKNKMD